MKKVGAFVVLLLLSLSLISFALADNNSTSTPSTPTSSATQQQDPGKVEKGFECLEKKAGDCSGLTTQEIAYTILATPKDSVFNDCVKELKSRKSSENWGNVRDTALAILALSHAGEDTSSAEKWILNHSRTPTELIWYLQQDSNEATECHIGYGANDYIIHIGENKKIDRDAGSCLTRARSNFWLKISPDCYDEEFTVECDKNFIATLLYKNKNTQTIHPIEGTDSAPAFGSIKLKLNSKCFGASSCDYESTAWATLALLKKGYNVEEYIPYLIAMAGTNKKYLPDAFTYIATNYENYATRLVADQKLGNYWEAKNSAYNRYYDTALALMAVGSSSSEKVTKAKDWLLFSQGVNGCWQNAVRETAFILWVLEGRAGRSPSGGSGVTYCSQANYFCIPSSDCPSSEDVGNNYFCPSLSDTCCMTENLQSCSEYGGKECDSGKVCTGNERKATDTDNCCTGDCVERTSETECESMFYVCRDSCSDSQEPVSAYACDGTQVCCKTKTSSPSGGVPGWIWVLVVLILVVLGAIGYVYREKLKLLFFKSRAKFKKDDRRSGGISSSGPPGFPPKPGFPPIRRVAPIVPPQRPSYGSRDKAMSETFKKLQEMSR